MEGNPIKSLFSFELSQMSFQFLRFAKSFQFYEWSRLCCYIMLANTYLHRIQENQVFIFLKIL